MGTMFYFVTVIGVFLQAVHGQDFDSEPLKRCPCENQIIENYLESVAKDSLDLADGQTLRLKLWQEKKDDCSVNIVDKSPNPGQIEINLAFRGSVNIEKQGEAENQYGRNDDQQQQQAYMGIGQQPRSVTDGKPQQDGEIETQQGEDNGQQQEGQDGGFLKAEELEEMISNIDIDELKQRLAQLLQAFNTEQEQDEVDNAQEQAGVNAEQGQAGVNAEQGQAGVNAEQGQAGVNPDYWQPGVNPAYGDAEVKPGYGQAGANAEQEQPEVIPNYWQSGVGVGYGMARVNPAYGNARVNPAYGQVGVNTEQEQEGINAAYGQAGVNTAQGKAGVNTVQKQSGSSGGAYSAGGKKDYSTAYSFSVDVNTGKLTDHIEAAPISNRRKRDLIPFDNVVITIRVKLNEEPQSDATTRNEQIKSLLGKNLSDYWLAMAYCLLGVKE